MRSATIEGYRRYLFYENGTVFNMKRNKFMRFHDDGRNGYLKIKLTRDDGLRVHWWLNRLIFTAFRGLIRPGMEIDHKDGNRINNCIDNLIEMTHRQNNQMKKQRDSNFLFNRKAPGRRDR